MKKKKVIYEINIIYKDVIISDLYPVETGHMSCVYGVHN